MGSGVDFVADGVIVIAVATGVPVTSGLRGQLYRLRPGPAAALGGQDGLELD